MLWRQGWEWLHIKPYTKICSEMVTLLLQSAIGTQFYKLGIVFMTVLSTLVQLTTGGGRNIWGRGDLETLLNIRLA